MRRDGTREAQAVLAEAHQAAEHLRQEVEQERAVLYAETAEVREYRDGLLEQTLDHKAQKAPAAEGTAEPEAYLSPRGPASRP